METEIETKNSYNFPEKLLLELCSADLETETIFNSTKIRYKGPEELVLVNWTLLPNLSGLI